MSRPATGDPPLEGGRENGCCRQPNKAKSLQLLHQMTDSQKPLVARCESEGVEITAVRMPGKREHIVNFVSRSRKGAGEDEVRVSGGAYRHRSPRCPPHCVKTVLCVAFLVLFVVTLVLIALLVRKTCSHLWPNSSSLPPTDAAEAPWKNFRLPTNLRPSHYRISIRTDFDQNLFQGNVNITFTCTESTNYILLHTRELNYTLDSFRFAALDENTAGELDGKPRFYPENDYVVLRTISPMEAGGEYSLSVSYQAHFNDKLIGLYKSKYDTSNGKTEDIVASFLSPINARLVFPCFDEPAFKANFTVSIVHPSAYIALSNMDPSTSPTRDDDGWTTTSFRTTPVMSTYLVAFVVCKFRHQEVTVRDRVKFRVWSRPDVIAQTNFALDVGVQLFNVLEDFSGFQYPLPKLDMIALPELIPAGMENWGLLTYREDFMLYDERETPTESLQALTFVIAHELGHQWYSNLVTQIFWDELWLKECFASIMGTIALEVLFPEWAMWDEQFVIKELQSVMKLDSHVTSHPIQQPVHKAGDIMDNFDMIAYQKSPAILRMLEHSIGYNDFKDGLAVFLQSKQYSNADAWDIWRAMSSISHGEDDYVDISRIMDPWLGQMGYPVVTVSRDCRDTPGLVCFHQEHFLLDRDPVSEVPESKYGYIWPIPITFTSAATGHDVILPGNHWLDSKAGQISMPNVRSDQWILININRTGFFRTNYDIDNWRLICQQLEEDHRRISPASRAVLIDDVFSLATEGRVNLSLALDLTRYLKYETEYVPWKGALVTFAYVDTMLRTTPVYGIFKEYLLYQAKTVYDFVGWNNTGPHQEKLLRVVILQQMCAYGHQGCIEMVQELFENATSGQTIPPDFRSFVYSARVASGGIGTWESTWSQYKSSTAAEAKNFLAALSATGEPWLINRLLARTLDQEQLSVTDAVSVFQYVSKNPIGGYLAWNFFRDQWEFLRDRYGSGLFQMNDIITAVTEWFNTRYQLEELEVFISSKREDLKNLAGASSFQQAVDTTKANIRWMAKNYGQIEEWLEEWKAGTS
ncbi:aminopeptidase N-like [Diadema antillarum]|uniref:aminopeptidase N-like n=1 Tax=Diadema antillarum TaxID=105358 RepID=UPI003A84C657